MASNKPPKPQPGAPQPQDRAFQKQAMQKQASEKHTPQRTVRFSSTAMAITGSLVIAVVLASLITINPVTAFRMAYTNYAGEVPASIATAGDAPAATARQGVQESEKPTQ